MPLPEKVIEQLGREMPRTPGWSGQLIMFSATLFLLSLLAYFGIVYGYTSYLQKQNQQLEDQIDKFSQQIPVSEQNQLIIFYSQIANLKSILGAHVYTSPAFDWLEKNTQANVTYTRFNLSTRDWSLTLDGLAKNLSDLNQQLSVFSARPEIRRLSFNSLSFVNGAWQFNLVLYFNPTFFYKSYSPPSQ